MAMATTIRAKDVVKRFRNLIDTLRYHVATGRFSYVDRIIAAMDSSVVEETVREAVRAALSAASAPRIAKGNPIEFNEEKKVWELIDREEVVEYVEEERIGRGRTAGVIIPARALLHGRPLQVGDEWKILYTPPHVPSERELADFLDEVRNDISVAKLVGSLAMTKPAPRGGEET
jgi:hypothetical protein